MPKNFYGARLVNNAMRWNWWRIRPCRAWPPAESRSAGCRTPSSIMTRIVDFPALAVMPKRSAVKRLAIYWSRGLRIVRPATRLGRSMRNPAASNAIPITIGQSGRKCGLRLLCRRCKPVDARVLRIEFALAAASFLKSFGLKSGSPTSAFRKSPVNQIHRALRIAQASDCALWSDFLDSIKILGCQLHLQRAGILFKVFAPFGSGDRDDVFALGQ